MKGERSWQVDADELADSMLHWMRSLHGKGFVLGPSDYAEALAVLDQLKPGDTESLMYYLAPIICKSQEEQERFYQLFWEDFLSGKKLQIGDGTHLIDKRWKSGWRFIALIAAVLTLILSAAWLLSRRRPETVFNMPVLRMSGNPVTGKPVQFFYIPDPRDTLKPDWFVRNDDDATNTETQIGSSTDTVTYVFTQPNNYLISARAAIPGVFMTVRISDPPFLTYSPKEPRIGDSLRLEYVGPDSARFLKAGNWNIYEKYGKASDTERAHSFHFSYYLRDSGYYYAGFILPGKTSHYVGITVGMQPEASIQVTSFGSISRTITREAWLFPLVFLSLLASLGLFYFLIRAEPEPPSQVPATDPLLQFKGMEPPFSIPFLQRDTLIQSLPVLSRVATFLCQRVEGEVPVLHIGDTVRETIRQQGYFSPVYRPRTHTQELLILVDASMADSPQVRLFAYLLRFFYTNNVPLSVYYYSRFPDKLYRQPGSPVAINAEQLISRHEQAHLVVIGNGYSWLERSLPRVSFGLTAIYDYWPLRILLTPVPAKDWDAKERILSDYFHLLPADIGGLLNLLRFINAEGAPSLQSLTGIYDYTVREVDTQNYEKLRDIYFQKDADLLQWLAATAVYPAIKWEVIIEIGDKVLRRRNAHHKLNYGSLLLLARIPWLQEGAWPAGIRFALLRNLEEQDELIARSAILGMLGESNDLIDERSFSYEEKVVEKAKNSFVLFANAGNDAFRDEAEEFMSLWEKGLISDAAQNKYLRKEGEWSTPVRSLKSPDRSVGIKEYIAEWTAKKQADQTRTASRTRLFKWLALGCLLLAAGAMLSLDAVTSSANRWAAKPFFRYLGVYHHVLPDSIDFSLNLVNNGCLGNNHSYFTDAYTLKVDDQPYFGRPDTAFKKNELTIHFGKIPTPADSLATLEVASNVPYFDASAPILLTAATNRVDIDGPICSAFDTGKKIIYIPARADGPNLLNALKTAYPGLRLLTPPDPRSNGDSANTIYFGNNVDPSTRYSITANFLQAGIRIKRISPILDGLGALALPYDPLNKIVLYGSKSADRDPVLTPDSLRCRLLGECPSGCVQVSYPAAIASVRLVPYYTDDMQTALVVDVDRLTIFDSSFNYWYPDTTAKKCGDIYTLYTFYTDYTLNSVYKPGPRDSLKLELLPPQKIAIKSGKWKNSYSSLLGGQPLRRQPNSFLSDLGDWAGDGRFTIRRDSIIAPANSSSGKIAAIYGTNSTRIYLIDMGRLFERLIVADRAGSKFVALEAGRPNAYPDTTFSLQRAEPPPTFSPMEKLPSILWLDSVPSSHAEVERAFTRVNVEIHNVTSMQEAIRLWDMGKYDLVISDRYISPKYFNPPLIYYKANPTGKPTPAPVMQRTYWINDRDTLADSVASILHIKL